MPTDSKSAQAREDVKEWLLHSQKVHFAIVIACVGLIVAANLGRRNDAAVALEDLKQIMDAVSRWDPGWLEEAVSSQAVDEKLELVNRADDQAALITHIRLCYQTWEPRRQAIRLYRWWTLLPLPVEFQKAWPDSTLSLVDNHAATTTVLPTPRTIREFEAMWDGLGDLRFTWITHIQLRAAVSDFVAGHDTVYFYHLEQCDLSSDTVSVSNADIVVLPENDYRADAEVIALLDSVSSEEEGWLELASADANAGEGYYVRTSEWYIGRDTLGWSHNVFLACQTASQTINGRFAFNEKFGTRFHTLPFSGGFSDLYNISKNYLDFEFDEARRVLESEKERTPAKFVFFGTEIPSDKLAIFGIPILLLMQLYLLAHLRNIPQIAAPETVRVPWIGIYNDPLGRALQWSSTSLLPAVTAGVLAWHGSTSLGEWVRYGLVVLCGIAALGLGLYSAKYLGQSKNVKSKSSTLR